MQVSWIPCSGRACHSSLRHVLVSFVSTSRIERDGERIPPLPPRGPSHPPSPTSPCRNRTTTDEDGAETYGSTGTSEGFLDGERRKNGTRGGPDGGDPTMPVEESRGKSLRILGAYRFDFDICREERFKPEGWRPPAPPSYRYSSRSHRYLFPESHRCPLGLQAPTVNPRSSAGIEAAIHSREVRYDVLCACGRFGIVF